MNIQTLKENMQNELFQRILPFWEEKLIDEENGGFYGRIDSHNILHKDAPKSIILNTRILWTYSAAYRITGNEKWLEIAHRAKHYLTRYFMDYKYGGFFWMLNCKGDAIDEKKQVYAQAFAIYALSEYYRSTKDEVSLQIAKDTFFLLEKHSFDSATNGYLEAFDREWTLLDDLRLSSKDANEAKTMNTHLHVLEAYTNLYRVWKEPGVNKQLVNLISLFTEKFIDQESHFRLFFDENWTLKSEEISFGHDIEGSWLLYEAAQVANNTSLLNKVQSIALTMAENVLKSGVDVDGGIISEANPKGWVNTDKHWWPQAEGIVGWVNAWQISNDPKFLNAALHSWQFIKNNILDYDNGEWYWGIKQNGTKMIGEDKAGPWKCPYHNGRACMEIMQRIDNNK